MLEEAVCDQPFLLLAVYFAVGAALGSFINVCALRLPHGLSVVRPPSRCEKCGHRLAAKDLIPLLSWLYLRGRCRYCGAKYGARYLLTEAFSGLLFAVGGAVYPFGIELLLLLFLCLLLLLQSLIDYDWQLLLDEVTLLVGAGGIIFAFVRYGSVQSGVYGAFAAGAVMLALYLISRGGMGLGDVKLACALGFWLYWRLALLFLLLAFSLGGVVGTALLILKIKSRRDAIPFGPCLCLAAYVALLWGERLLLWYRGFFY